MFSWIYHVYRTHPSQISWRFCNFLSERRCGPVHRIMHQSHCMIVILWYLRFYIVDTLKNERCDESYESITNHHHDHTPTSFLNSFTSLQVQDKSVIYIKTMGNSKQQATDVWLNQIFGWTTIVVWNCTYIPTYVQHVTEVKVLKPISLAAG